LLACYLFLPLPRRPPPSTLFPYTTLFRSGKLYGWYGIGQPLLMLPSDVLGTYLDNLPIFAEYQGTDPTVRDIVVSYSTNILVCRSEEHTSELQSRFDLVCRLLLEKKKHNK